ncbi:10985_t:CDS:2 [Cetraspora pellucida]|uniref:10985_t:CDS:1 n=1 Tax=Cetraspora pellucida TaxID=1433469 RepID=A0A9N9GM78_9GLOM|nr:10985_t:CDS:2 [Cetraspora pellucida]
MTKIWSTFSRNFAKLLEDSEGHDLIINVGQEPIIKPFKAHSVILRAHSPYFRRALSKEWAKKEDGKTVFYKPNVSPPIFEIILKFTLMTREQFREKVWPFKDILPRKMCDDVLWHFLMPEIQPSQFHPRLKTIDSKLITLKHASLIATWIDRKEGKPYKHTDIPYDFTLLMRGSRDGYSQQTLHQRCGGQAKTIMLMKIKSTEEIFGMYISNIWSNTSSARSHDSFMFSFGEGRDTKDPVLSRVRAAGYDLALSRGQERGMDELEMFKISPKTVFML